MSLNIGVFLSQSLRNNASSNLNMFDTLPTMSDQYRNKHGGVKPKHVNTLEIKQLHAGKKYTSESSLL